MYQSSSCNYQYHLTSTTTSTTTVVFFFLSLLSLSVFVISVTSRMFLWVLGIWTITARGSGFWEVGGGIFNFEILTYLKKKIGFWSRFFFWVFLVSSGEWLTKDLGFQICVFNQSHRRCSRRLLVMIS